MNEKHKLILSIIAISKEPMTGREVYEKMEPAEQGLFRGVDDVNGTLTYLRKHRGLVENGESIYEKGRAILTYKLTKRGREMIEKNQPTQNDVEIDDSVIFNENDDNTIISEQEVTDQKEDDPALKIFDDAVAYMRQSIALALKKPTIQNKYQKIDNLEKVKQMSELFGMGIDQCMQEIIDDYKSFEDV